MKASGIYTIHHIVSGKKYVGQAVNIGQRWTKHKWELRGGAHINRHLQAAWNKYGADAFKFSVVEHCDVDQLNEREMYHIAIWKSQDLCYNQTEGGGGCRGYVPSAETRAKLSASGKGKVFSDEHRAKISAAKKGKVLSAETKAKMGAANKGNQHSLGYTHTDEAKAKMGAANKGNQHSLGYTHTDEARAKISAAGRNRSDETKAKISAAQIAAWAAKKKKKIIL